MEPTRTFTFSRGWALLTDFTEAIAARWPAGPLPSTTTPYCAWSDDARDLAMTPAFHSTRKSRSRTRHPFPCPHHTAISPDHPSSDCPLLPQRAVVPTTAVSLRSAAPVPAPLILVTTRTSSSAAEGRLSHAASTAVQTSSPVRAMCSHPSGAT